MESLRSLYKIGFGPSSSHTMGPRRAAVQFGSDNLEATSFRVSLYGSLAATGKGHQTDKAILDGLAESIASAGLPAKPVELLWFPKVFKPFHSNGMLFEGLNAERQVIRKWEIYSIGGGYLGSPDRSNQKMTSPYPHSVMSEILAWCQKEGKMIWEYALEYEGEAIFDYLAEVWEVMKAAVRRGLDAEGVLPGGLGLQRKASAYNQKARGLEAARGRGLLFSYALAVAEENAASTGLIVTAPTCGAAGVLPAVLYHLAENHAFHEKRIIRALATAGIFGIVVKKNASISGAEVGCQGEIGVACAMAAAAATQLFGGSPGQVEYAAEMGLEHHLGLTCDPICGLVQIPCIERNAFGASRAMDANLYSSLSDGIHRISFDKVVRTMLRTGHDIPSLYKETSEGGLARDE